MQQVIISAPDGHNIEAYSWTVENPTAWIHILHGMSEHVLRYDEFAKQLNHAGFNVLAHNHRGHGTSTTTTLGSYAPEHGWDKVLNDIDLVRNEICQSKLPYIIFAHSMGSFIAQSYLVRQPQGIHALILSGSNFQAPWLSKAGLAVASLEKLRIGENHTSKLMQFLSFGSFNNAFKPNRTEYDWLSRDEKQVDQYIQDPLCGFACQIGLWQDLLKAMAELYTQKSLQRIQKNLPIFILGGDKDPVGQMGKGLVTLKKTYEQLGQKDIQLKLYKDGRHEMLNEINRQEVYQDVITWVSSKLS